MGLQGHLELRGRLEGKENREKMEFQEDLAVNIPKMTLEKSALLFCEIAYPS